MKPLPADLVYSLTYAGIDPEEVTEWSLEDGTYLVRLKPKVDHVDIKVIPVSET